MRIALVAVLLFPGCMAPAQQPPVPWSHDDAWIASDHCPVTGPGGEPFDCEADGWAPPKPVPAPDSLWRCAEHFEDDWGNAYETWVHPDGMLGGRVLATPWKGGGVSYVHMRAYLAEGGVAGQAILDGDTWLELPEGALDGEAHIYLTFMQARLFERQADGMYQPIDEGRVLVRSYGPVSWFVYYVPSDDLYIDLNRFDPRVGEKEEWERDDVQVITPSGRDLVVGHQGAGVKYIGQGAMIGHADVRECFTPT